MKAWIDDKGSTTHQFSIHDDEVLACGFEPFSQFFLRNIKLEVRPLCDQADDPRVIVAPCDGGVFYLTRGEPVGSAYQLPGKSRDTFELQEALPGYGASFLGGRCSTSSSGLPTTTTSTNWWR